METTPELQYITSDQVGKVIYEGLASLYETKPDFPVTYLANWLLNYCATQNNEVALKETEVKKQVLIEKCNRIKQEQQVAQQEQEEKQAAIEKVQGQFRNKVEEHLYLEELLSDEFPEFLKKSLNLPAVYVGHHSHLVKRIAENEEDPNAHLDTTQEKVIRFIGASKNQKFLIGNHLAPETGVTYDVLKPKEEEDAGQQPDEEGEGVVTKTIKPTYLYVPDVTKESRMNYFRIPKLGSYITCPLVYRSVLSEVAFDEGVKERLRVQEARLEQQKEREAKEVEYQQKIEDAEDQGLNTQDLEEEWKNTVWEDIREKDFESVVQEFVLSADTLGEDRGMSEEQRKNFEESAKFFMECWEKSEQKQLSNDIDRQLKYLKEFNKGEYLKEFNYRIEDDLDERIKTFERNEDFGEPSELKTNYLQALAKAEICRDFLNEEDTKNLIMNLKDYRVVKYQVVIQNALFLAGYFKGQINQTNTNVLDWKVAKNYINDNDFFKKLYGYQIRGAKADQIKPYTKPQKILRRLEGIVADEIDEYNVGLGVLYKFVKQVLEARVLDYEVRKAERAAKIAKREQLIQDDENLVVAKEQALEQARTQVPEGEEFDQDEWERDWEESNPAITIPDEVAEEIDLDMEPDFEETM